MNTTVEKIQSLLGQDATRPWWKRATLWGTLAVLVALAAAGVVWQGKRAADAQPRYVAEPVTRGHLVVTVAANGILAPTNKADIGSELSGTVARVLVDVNDTVKKGQVLAELDTAKLDDQVMRSRAALDVAHAKVRQSQATVQEATGNLQRLQEVARLSGGRVPSQAEMATAQATLARAQADATGAQASVADATAALSADETNRRKASIRSPINGIVLSRSVDPGNAVAASLQAVTLFTLAEDLSQMKLAVNVDEADVGHVRNGQKATFSVSAYPNRNYPATVTRVSYGSTTKDNVVTYIAELSVDNADLSLRPGMTAGALIVATERNDVLLVPNAALRFTPATVAVAPADAASTSSFVSKLIPRMPQRARRTGNHAATARQVWVLKGNEPVAVTVTAGATDGRLTEVTSDTLQPGMAVITEQSSGERSVSDAANATGALIRLRGVSKVYGAGQAAVYALRDVDLDIDAGEFVAIMGPSGSGKSTAMNVIGCLDTPSSGEYFFQDVATQSLTRDQRARLRRRHLGFVFQGFNLLPRTSAQENVELPLLYRGESAKARHAAAVEALASVGLAGWEHHTPAELSGGQQQRVAIARALVTKPTVLLADEPTGNLDSQRGREIMDLLRALNVDRGITVVMVTHEPDMAAYARRVVRFVDGRIDSDVRNAGTAALPATEAA